MKDILIKGTTIKREIIIGLVCFLFVFLVNVYAIYHYNSLWSELLTQLYEVIIIAAVLYLLIVFIRLIVLGIKKLFSQK